MAPRPQSPAIAALFMIAATVFIAATMLLAKLLGKDTLGPPMHPLQISQGRFFFALLVLGLAVATLRPRFSRPDWRLHAGRTISGWAGVTLMFAAVVYIPLSDATAITFLNPVFCMLLAIPLLGERIGRWRWLAAALALCGAMVLLRPGPESFKAAALLAIVAAMVIGMELIFVKKLADREPPLQILVVNNLLGLGLATLSVLPVFAGPTGAQWLALAALGVLMAAAQACFVNAMARADASFVTPFSYLTLIFAALYDAAIFGVLPDGVSFAGAGIILGGAALLAWREGRARRQKNA